MGSRRLIAALLGAASLLTAASAQGAVTVGHSGWNWGSPSPQGQTIRAVEFEGARGYAVGAFGTVLVTDDSGVTWTGAATGTTQALDWVSVVGTDSVVVSGGCVVSGATVRRSVLFSNVRVEEGALLEDCVVLPDVVIGPGVRLCRAIIDRHCRIDSGGDLRRFRATDRDVLLITPEMLGQQVHRLR